MSRDPRPATEAAAAVRDEARLRELDRKSAATSTSLGALAVRARHAWTGSATVPAGGAVTALTGWATAVNDGIATYRGEGVFRLTRAGVWAAGLVAGSDAAAAGNFQIALRCAGLFTGTGELRCGGYTGSGFPGAGYDERHLLWVGPVTAAQAAADLTVAARWYSATDLPRTATYRLNLTLLGADPT